MKETQPVPVVVGVAQHFAGTIGGGDIPINFC